MSTIVVTPPAAALRVDQMKSSWPFWLRLCTWASIAPGQHEKSGATMFLAGRRRAGTDPLHQAVADQHVTVLDDPIRQHHRAREHLIGHEFSFLTKRFRTNACRYWRATTDEDGPILSPCRYDAAANHALQ